MFHEEKQELTSKKKHNQQLQSNSRIGGKDLESITTFSLVRKADKTSYSAGKNLLPWDAET